MFSPSILFFAGQLYFCELMFLIDKPKRKLFPLRLILGLAIYLTLSNFIVRIPLPNFYFTMIWFFGIILYSILLNLFVFRIPFYENLFAINAGYALQNLIFSVGTITFYNFTPRFDFNIWTDRLAYDILFQILPYVTVCLPLYFLIVRKRVRDGTFARQDWLTFITLPLVTSVTIILGVLSDYNAGADAFRLRILFRIAIVICCFLMLVMQFSICTIRKNKRDIDILNCMLEMQKNQYQLSKTTIDQLNVKFHDLKHQLSSLQLLDDTKKATQIEDLKKKTSVYNSIAKTGNASMDLVLMEKNLLCHKLGIALSYIVKNGSEMSFVQPSDLYSILANAFDNAIEYVKNLDDEKKYINLNITKKLGAFFIHMDNYLEEKPKMNDGIPLSTKTEDIGLHGYGIKSMKLIAEKYSGNLSISTENSSFILNIMIPIPETA